MTDISPHAIVERTAKLAEDVRVGHFSYIGPHVQLGPGCVIDNSVTITGRTTLGAKNHVFPMAVIGAAEESPDGPGRCTIGQANAIREHVTIYAGADKPTQVGSDNLIMIGCQIGPGAVVGDHGIFANCTYVGPAARVEDYVRSSGFAIIQAKVTVGAYTFTAGYADIDRDAPPYAIVQGCPFRVRGVNTENLKRCGFGEDDIRALKDAFRELFDPANDKPSAKALRKLHARAKNTHVLRLVEFIRSGPAPAEGDDG